MPTVMNCGDSFVATTMSTHKSSRARLPRRSQTDEGNPVFCVETVGSPPAPLHCCDNDGIMANYQAKHIPRPRIHPC